MGKTTGFMEYERKNGGYRPVEERIKDYREVIKMLPKSEVTLQGARCMDCGIPFCHSIGCPLYNLIPEWNDAVYNNDYQEALDRLLLTNNFPEITGRICPAPCEDACTLAINRAPVAVKEIELAIIEEGFRQGWVKPQQPSVRTDQRVAVVGSGPAGLATADCLSRSGHEVVVFEKAANSGGLLRYGIPDFKLEKKIIDRRLNLMQEQGIRFECNVEIGEDISMRYLKNNYDAVVLAIGAGKPRDLPLASRSLQGIYFAMEYLTASNKFTAGEIDKKDIITAENKNVLVIGGGDTGSDCVGTAVRQNAARVYQFEILPRPSQWSKPENPSWPCRPQILKSTSSHAEGCDRRWGVSVKKFSSSGLKVQRAHFEKVKWYTDHKGKQCFEPIKGSDFAVDAQLVILAMGFLHVEHSGLLDRLKLKLDKRDNIWTDQNNMTSEPGIFAAGDGVSGASLVVTAIKAGRQTAAAVDKYLAHV